MKQAGRHSINYVKGQVRPGSFVKRPFGQPVANRLSLHNKADRHKFSVSLYPKNIILKCLPPEFFSRPEGQTILCRKPVIDMADNILI